MIKVMSDLCTDVLANDDAVALAGRIDTGEITAFDAVEATIRRLQKLDPTLNALVCDRYVDARKQSQTAPAGLLAGVPTLLKDNADITGMPTRHGSRAVPSQPAQKNGLFIEQLLSSGLIPLGKTALPEFGLTATTEFSQAEPCRNPWNPEHSTGGSSGGSAALVAAGAVPIAHANDGGGSIRIPAACCGVVGLKPSRGRLLDDVLAKKLPLNIVSEGVVTRSVRDTAVFHAACEQHWHNPKLPEIGQVEGPSKTRLRIAICSELHDGSDSHPETVAALEKIAAICDDSGHQVKRIPSPLDARMAEDFFLYWAMLAASLVHLGKLTIHRDFEPKQLEPLTLDLAKHFRKNAWRFPGALRRLQRYHHRYTAQFKEYDLLLTPTLAHPPPELGYLNPGLPFEETRARLFHYAAFTPAQNVTGAPAISLPLGQSKTGLPIGLQLAATRGMERRLLEVAYELEGTVGWPNSGSGSL